MTRERISCLAKNDMEYNGEVMISFIHRTKGTIAVFLTLILIPTFIFGGVMIDGTRVYGSKNLLSGAGEMALNGALANYDTELNDYYGLLAMAKSPDEVEGILQEYFEDTLNAQGLTTDDLSRALIYLDVLENGFEASPVSESEIYRTEVLKADILEYMKVRGPVMMTENILGKIGDFKDLHNQQVAVKKQMKFKSDVQDLAEIYEKLYEKVCVEYEDSWDYIYSMGVYFRPPLGSSYTTEEVLDAIHADAREVYEDASAKTVYYNSIKNCSAKTTKSMLDAAEAFSDSDLQSKAQNIDNLHDSFGALLEIKKMYNKYDTDVSDILDDVDKHEDPDEYAERNAWVQEFKTINNFIDGVLQDLTDDVNDRIDKPETHFYSIHAAMITASDALNDIPAIMNELNDEMEKLREEYDEWKNAVDKVQTQEVKEEYQKDLADYEDFFADSELYEEFMNKVETNTAYYPEMIKVLEGTTFNSKSLTDQSTSWTRFRSEGATSPYNTASTSGEMASRGKEFCAKYFHNSPEWSTSPGGLHHALMDPEHDELVKRMKEYWVQFKEQEDEEKREEEGTKQNESLSASIKKYAELFLTTDIKYNNMDVDFADGYPSKWLEMAEGDVSGDTELDIDADAKEKKQNKEITSKISDFTEAGNAMLENLSKLGDLLQGAAEDAFITEYGIDMFSNYVSNKDSKGNVIDDPISLSGWSLNKDKYYRTEAEYIIWGDPDARDNITKTKAVIFAIHLVCNLVYVTVNFRNHPDVIAASAWAPGPWAIVVRIAVLSILALKQTVTDLDRLMQGKQAELIKTKDHWSAPLIYTKDEGKIKGFSYHDWLWLFMMINSMENESAVLGRIADCIEFNRCAQNKGNTLRTKYTMVQIDAKAVTNTYFLQNVGALGGPSMDLPEGGFVLNYKGVKSY